MSRASRVARGSLGSAAATLIAAASHTLAGGVITWIAVVATAIVALPLCTALAGRIGSLWRLAIAITSAQFLFHWSFAGLGMNTGGMSGGGVSSGGGLAGGSAAGPHAAHLGAIQSFAPDLLTAGSADLTMWIGHACAAVGTIALLHRGERAFLSLIRLVRRGISVTLPRLRQVSSRKPVRTVTTNGAQLFSRRWISIAAITHRGPPLGCVSFSTHI